MKSFQIDKIKGNTPWNSLVWLNWDVCSKNPIHSHLKGSFKADMGFMYMDVKQNTDWNVSGDRPSLLKCTFIPSSCKEHPCKWATKTSVSPLCICLTLRRGAVAQMNVIYSYQCYSWMDRFVNSVQVVCSFQTEEHKDVIWNIFKCVIILICLLNFDLFGHFVWGSPGILTSAAYPFVLSGPFSDSRWEWLLYTSALVQCSRTKYHKTTLNQFLDSRAVVQIQIHLETARVKIITHWKIVPQSQDYTVSKSCFDRNNSSSLCAESQHHI